MRATIVIPLPGHITLDQRDDIEEHLRQSGFLTITVLR